MTANLAPHEIIDLRELISRDITQYKKLNSNMSDIKDTDLKTFIDKSSNTKKDNINSLQGFIDSSN